MLQSKTNQMRKPLYLIGQGFYDCVIPTFIKNHFLRNPHIYSPYTPYQAEISQGRLELLHTYQNIVKTITQKEVCVASLIDCGQIGMDLITIMKNKTKKRTVLVQSSLYQPVLNAMSTRADHQNINFVYFEKPSHILYFSDSVLQNIAGIITQTPDRYGEIKQSFVLNEVKHHYPEMITACLTDLMFLQKYQLDFDYDFVFGNATNMGIGLNYGGPQPAFLSSNGKYIRDLPGKIIGTTLDRHGNDGYYLALQTREQHIKREKATSNVCTNQALLANMMSSYCLYHGMSGLKTISNKIHDLNKIFYLKMNNLDINNITHNFYNHLSFEYDFHKYRNLLLNLEKHDIYPFQHYIGRVGFSFDESHDYDDVDYVVKCLKKLLQNKGKIVTNGYSSGDEKLSFVDVKNPFNDEQQSLEKCEQSVLRYLHNLSRKDYSLMDGMIPLGSCTMKHTPVDSMDKVTQTDMNIHPYIDIEKTKYHKIINKLTKQLKDVTGFDNVFYQSQSGAMGEYAGLTIMRKYFSAKKMNRNIVLLPNSAHGTNPSSCSLAGFKIKKLKETKEGFVDMDHFHKVVDENKDNLAGLMITYPSTYGQYEKNIKEINEKVHSVGGLVYMDGANTNALIGYQKPEELGFDICHFNLHKTFAIPHGGGGPGMGPIAFRGELSKYVPAFSSQVATKSISSTPYGSGLILQISEHYIDNYITGKEIVFHNDVIGKTKYVIDQLKDDYNILHSDSEYRAHEFIIDTSMFKKAGVKDIDISKRLIDYGFHPPTMSWPVVNSLMIEVTESEDYDEIERFILAMKMIRSEIDEKPELLKNAPHCQEDIVDWSHDYSVQEACYPYGMDFYKKKEKFWATHSRLESLYGDKKLLAEYLSK